MKTKLSEEIFKMRFIDCYDQYKKRKLTCEEAAELLKEPGVGFVKAAHAKEHSIEIQLPFIQYMWPGAEIIPILTSNRWHK